MKGLTPRTILFGCIGSIHVIDAWVALPFSPFLHDATAMRQTTRTLAADLSGKAKRKVSEEEEMAPLRPVLPADYQDTGSMIISKACASVTSNAQTDIEWKGDHIIVTLRGEDMYMSATDADEGGFEEDTEVLEEDADSNSTESPTVADNDKLEMGIDVTAVAKAINLALDCSAVGQAIAETHSLEVTTPGASDELQGDRMFSAYQGFDVTVVYEDPKKNKKRTIQGRLVERTDEHVIINVKGRTSKLVRDKCLSVQLPKAKREK